MTMTRVAAMETVKSGPMGRTLQVPDEALKKLGSVVGALLILAGVAHAGPVRQTPQVGDTYQRTLAKDSAQKGSNRSQGSSHDQGTLIEAM
jgi:hypothetical protein